MSSSNVKNENGLRLDADTSTNSGITNRQSGSYFLNTKSVSRFGMAIAVGLAACLAGLPTTSSAGQEKIFLAAQKTIIAPPGFVGLCTRHAWVCKSTENAALSSSEKMTIATEVNLSVNRQVRQIEDRQQYGKDEHWALPTKKGGDCEDLALLKKKMLLDRGISSDTLLIATVLDKELNSHAVLVMRTAGGDMVLDNLTNQILPWHETGYTFLKMQKPESLEQWDAIIVGGVVNDRPTASR